VKNSRLTSEIIWFNAFDELKYKIAHGTVNVDERGKITEELVGARVNGEPALIHNKEVELIDVSCQQIISVAVSLIPFLVT